MPIEYIDEYVIKDNITGITATDDYVTNQNELKNKNTTKTIKGNDFSKVLSCSMILFIPFKGIPVGLVPKTPIDGVIYVKGDDRQFDYSGNSNEYRTRFDFEIEVTNNGITLVDNKIKPERGFTEYYYIHNLTNTKISLWEGRAKIDKEIKIKHSTSKQETKDYHMLILEYTYSCKIPFPSKEIEYLENLNPAPAIDGSGKFIFAFNKKKLEIMLKQRHIVDGFPAYEYYCKVDENVIPVLLYMPEDIIDALNLFPKVGDDLITQNYQTMYSGLSKNQIWRGARIVYEDE